MTPHRRKSAPARLARANDVKLWDREVPVTKLLAVGNEVGVSTAAAQRQAEGVAEDAVGNSSDEADRCVTCGAPVSEKVRGYCLARPARYGGRIYCFKHQRGALAAEI